MKPYSEIVQNIQTLHELGETIQAAYFVLKEYDEKGNVFAKDSIIKLNVK